MDFAAARTNMVNCQLRPNKLTNSQLIERFSAVPREMFVDTGSKEVAYTDTPLPIGHNREMFTPMVQARMLQALDLGVHDKVLVTAAGTGYTTCLLAPLVKEVHAVEENGYLLDVAKRAVADSHLHNVTFTCSKPEKGAPKSGPFTRILVDAAVEELPDDLIKQLAPHGRLCAVVASSSGLMDVCTYTKVGNTLFETQLFETKASILTNFKAQERFVF